MARLAEALLPLLADDEEEARPPRDGAARALLRASSRRRTCASCAPSSGSRARTRRTTARSPHDLLERLADERRRLHACSSAACARPPPTPRPTREVAALFADPAPSTTGPSVAPAARQRGRSRPRRARRAMRRANPAFIPRNHRVEEAIAGRRRRGDFEPFETLVRGARPAVRRSAGARAPRRAAARRKSACAQTFCGT